MDYVKAAEKQEFIGKNHKTLKLLGRWLASSKEMTAAFFAVEAGCKHQGADLLGEYNGGTIACCPATGGNTIWKADNV